MNKRTTKKAFKMLSDELTRKNYVALFGDYSKDENDDFTMTDEVDAINTFAEAGEVYPDSYEALVHFSCFRHALPKSRVTHSLTS